MEALVSDKPHAVCVPFPLQSHITAMMQLAKLLHSKGFFITFVNTEFNHRRLLKSRGPESVKGSDEFRFETIIDGLESSDDDTMQDIPSLCASTQKNCLTPFRNLLRELGDTPDVPRVTCIISDGCMSFTLEAATEFGFPDFLFWPISASSLLASIHFPELIERGLIPPKDENYLSNGYLDTAIDWLPGMRGMRLNDLPGLAKLRNLQDVMFKFSIQVTQSSFKASGNVCNTFDDLEQEVLNALRPMLGSIYTIGPLNLLSRRLPASSLKSIKTNLWKEDQECLEWLNKQEAASVVYVNFGSMAVLTEEQLIEFAWGFANSKHPFLWIVRPDVLMGHQATLPEEFMAEIKERGVVTSWCPQEEVLLHPSIGVFLTHCGWNSIIESICGGVPMICWPFSGDQLTSCRYVCHEWGIGVQINSDPKRDEVETVVRAMVEGEKGKEMRMKARKWKVSAESAIRPGGSSDTNLDRLVHDVLQLIHK